MPKQYKKTSSSSSRGLPFSPPYYPPPPKPAAPPPAAARISGKNPSLNGTGYGGDAREDKRRREQGKKEAKAKERSLLQSQYQILKKAAASMEQQQQQQQPLSNEILDVLKQFLRNYSSNSITDYKLYDVALKICDQLCQFHPKQLGSLEQQQQDDDEEDSSSVLIALQEAAQTSQWIVKNPTKSDSNNQRQQHQQHHQLAHRVVGLFEQAKKASDAVHSRPDLMVSSKEDQYRQSLRPFCFQFCNHLKSHFFSKKTFGSRTNVKRLFAELSTYATALPVEYGSSILVRAVEDQSHLLRALIFGPEDTPYANGCFVFDICLENYPYEPPRVQFLTTGGGKYRFNPNLYKDGKVCLSLLGTWSGPGWQPNESTLLQVLVSIQSLILGTSDPYFNEPGYQSSMNTSQGKKQSQNYNRNLQQHTLHAAMLPFMENPNMYPEFQQAISKHYDLKQSRLQQQLTQWATENPLCVPHYNNCLAIWSKQQALKRQSRHRGHNHSSTTKQPPQTDRITAREVNGVIEIDLDDEDDVAFQTAVQASLAEESPSSQQKKPAAAAAAVAVASCSDTNHESTRPASSCGNNTIITHAASCLSKSVNSEIDLCAAEELEDNQNIQESIAATNVSRPTTVLKETNHNVAAYSLSCNTMEQENRISGAIVLDLTEDD